jgi:hypothetical protein
VQRGLLLDVVVGQGALVLQLLPGEDQALLVRRDACKIASHCMDHCRLNTMKDGEGDRPCSLITRALFAHTFLVLDLGLDDGDGVADLDLESHRLPRQRLDEDLHLAGSMRRPLSPTYSRLPEEEVRVMGTDGRGAVV